MKLRTLLLALLCAPALALAQATVTDAWSPPVRWEQPNGFEVTPIHAGLLPDGRLFFVNHYSYFENAPKDLAAPGFDPEFAFFMQPSAANATPPASVVIQPIPNPPALGRTLTATSARFKTLACSGHALTAEGRIFFASGPDALIDLPLYNSGDYINALDINGIAEVVVLDPATGGWTQLPNTIVPGPDTAQPLRWYATVTRLADRRMLVTGGYERVFPDLMPNASVEVYDPATNAWTKVAGHAEIPGVENPEYTHVFPFPDRTRGANTVLMMGGSGEPVFLTLNGNAFGWTRTNKYRPGAKELIDAMAPMPAFPNHGASSAMLPIRLPESGWGYANGSLIVAGGDHHSVLEEQIDVYDPVANAWRPSIAMQGRRGNASVVLLPDGRVLVIGGHDSMDPATAGFAEYVDPRNGFTLSRGTAQMAEVRAYHSVVVLLPDGRVLVGGGNTDGEDRRERDDFRYYSPDYMDKPRPGITAAPAALRTASEAFVLVPHPSTVDEVVLMALGSHTHSFDMGQRYVQLRAAPSPVTVRQEAGRWVQAQASACAAAPGTCHDLLRIEAPPLVETASPGHYMLFTLDAARVPSVAKIVKLEPPGEGIAAAGSLAFAGTSLQTTSLARTLTIRNPGDTPVEVALVALSAGPFAFTHDCSTLAAGATCTASVTFTPVAEGAANATLTVVSSGGTLSIPVSGTGERSLVAHYYAAILGREPDAAGRAFWAAEAARMSALGADVNETWLAMAQSFFGSAEYAAFGRSDAGYVTDLYRTFFNRAADGAGFGFWTGLLADGLPREAVLAAFVFSPEFIAFTRALFGDTSVRSEVATIVDFYRGLLSRLPDDAGFGYWRGRFRTAQCAGPPAVYAEVEAISNAFQNSAEYAARNRTDAQFVADMYNAFMRRGADLPGVQFWVGQLGSGARTRDEVRRAFITTPEFSRRVAALVSEGCSPP